MIGSAALVVALAAIASLGALGRERPPLDPDSTQGDGLRGLRDTLEALDAQVRVDDEVTDADDVALLVAHDPHVSETDLRAWVADGGRLVATDPRSNLTPRPTGSLGLFGGSVLARECDVEALAGVDRVRPGGQGVVYEPPAGADACFLTDTGAWLTVTPEGGGTIVALGGPTPLTNAWLGSSDHAALAGALLAPRRSDQVVLLRPPAPGGGDRELGELLPPGTLWAGLQLLLAFALLVWWRAVRHGPVVTEPPAVSVAGSELTLATADLREQHRARHRAAASLRGEARRVARQRLGLPPDASGATLVAACERAGLPRELAERAMTAPDPADDAALIDLAAAGHELREVLTRPVEEGMPQ